MPLIDTDFAKSRVGTTLGGRYRLEELIAVGGTACVYRGRHRNGNRVAVKVLHPVHSLNADIRQRFAKEGYAANAVEHPRAVRVLDDDVADGQPFLVMELLEGETIAERWERQGRALPVQEVVSVGCDVLEVLVAAHDHGIIHRDIKPENLFLTRWGELKVLDFGIARFRDAAGAAFTSTGRIPGTPAFMAREQALGFAREIDARTDLWAVGATMFTLLTGKHVHEAETVEQMLVFAASEPARSLADVLPAAPAELIAVVDRALAFDKNDRYPDAATMLAALAPLRTNARLLPESKQPLSASAGDDPADAARAIGSTTDAMSTAHSPSDVALRRRALPIAALALLVTAAVAAAFFLRHPATQPGDATGDMRPSSAASPASPLGSDGASSSAAPAASELDGSPPETATSAIATAARSKPDVRPRASASVGSPASMTPPPGPAAPAVSGSVSPNCDPPVYIDPATGTRRVRPGCG